MISTEAAPHDRDAASIAGANFYLVKPVEPAFLTACAAMLCGLQS
jgi:two-component system chemotaxis response regulator CheY